LHWDLSQSDLEVSFHGVEHGRPFGALVLTRIKGLFGKIGPLIKVELIYDRAGRSEGLAYVTYEEYQDAKEAVREFDGANAKGQPIRLSILPSGPRRNPFDTAQLPGRSLADRITAPTGRSRSYSPDIDRGIDRYVPAGGRRSRSPISRRRGQGGRRPGQRREGGGQNTREGGERKGREGRPKKTQEELDAEMADYFAPGGARNDAPAAQATEAQVGGDDIDMIE
jgi:THO complex subunit 4